MTTQEPTSVDASLSVKELTFGLKDFISAARGRKATDLLVLDVRKLTSFTDFFMICSGKSNRQVTAIAEHIRRDLKNKGRAPISVEGLKDGQWVLMDYGHILVHVFLEPVREFYDLEGFWSGAGKVSVETDDTEKTEERKTDLKQQDGGIEA